MCHSLYSHVKQKKIYVFNTICSKALHLTTSFGKTITWYDTFPVEVFKNMFFIEVIDDCLCYCVDPIFRDLLPQNCTAF